MMRSTRTVRQGLWRCALVLGLSAGGMAARGAQPAAEDYMGRWEIWIENAGDSFGSAWLEVRSDGGKLAGSLLWKWGSVLPAEVEVAGGELIVTRQEDGKPVQYRARLDEKGELAGSTKGQDGAELKFKGRRAVEGREMTREWAAARERSWGAPVSLFDGKTLDGWHPRDASRTFAWHVTPEGTMRNTPPDVDIVSDAKFRDFKLHLEFKLAPNSNSGVYLRGRYEVQVVDDHGRGISPHGNGAVYSRIPASQNASKPAGEWQAFDITLIGQWLTVVLNGTTIIDHQHLDGITGGALDPWQAEPGPLMLQGDHGLVEYRNVIVTPAE